MKKGIAAATLAVLSLSMVGCGAAGSSGTSATSGNNSGSNSKPITIAMVPKLVGIPYFQATQDGAEKAAKALGVNLDYTGPTTADSASQIKIIEDLIAKHVNVIAVAPDDPNAIEPVLEKAKRAGIKVMDWDTAAGGTVTQVSVHQIDDKVFGAHMADLLAKDMGESGDYAMITGGLDAANLNAWIDAAKSEISAKYPNLHLVTSVIGTDEKQQIAYQKTLALLQAYPHLKGILAFSTIAPLGSAQAVKDQNDVGKVFVVGDSMPKDSAPFLKNGSMSQATLWDPMELGYLTVALGKDLANGKMPTDGESVANVGKIQVLPDGRTVIMGPPQDYTKSNVDQFNY